MVPFFFRADRIDQDLNMSVGLRDIHAKKLLPDIISTTVINFSPGGACLIVPTMAINGKHLFFDTLNSNLYNIVLFSGVRHDVGDEFTISAKSIWMDSCEHENKPSFKIGIRFLHNQKKLFKIFKERSQP